MFTPGNTWLQETINYEDPASVIYAQDRAALHRAINLAIESAFTNGLDLPVGAVSLQGGEIIGRGFAKDKRHNLPQLHAERMAILDTEFDVMGGKPDTIVSSLEPCNSCQDFLAQESSIRRVVFGVRRAEIVAKGLARPAEADIFQRADRLGFSYEVTQVDDEQLCLAGLTIFGYIKRDIDTDTVEVDVAALHEALVALNIR